ncbi:MAG TPA: retropepsin-like aspartic protease [Kofleriaceae bacterium]|nr:retropepsin-like aspartic protease [Kofleriaceae bacterium]
MQLTFRHELAFVTATLTYSGVSIEIANVLVDTGAASTTINADLAADAGVFVSPTDTLRRLRGVGGHEHVFSRRVDRFAIGDHGLNDFELEIGEMDYGFQLGGILGMDFLRTARAVLDLDQLTIDFV